MDRPNTQGKRGPKPQGRPKCGKCNGAGTVSSGSGRARSETTCPDCDGTGER
jgi:DnaJ-class molecular chaperone